MDDFLKTWCFINKKTISLRDELYYNLQAERKRTRFGSTFNWNIVRSALGRMKFDNDIESAQLLILTMAPFSEETCQDPALLSDLNVLNALYLSKDLSLYEKKIISYLYLKYSDRNSEELSSFFCKIGKEADQGLGTATNTVLISVRQANFHLLRMCLKFGAKVDLLKYPYLELERHIPVFENFLSPDPLRHVPEIYHEARRRLKNIFIEPRISLVSLCLVMLRKIQKPSVLTEQYVICLRMLFEAVPEPIVSSEEISNFLNKFLYGIDCENYIQHTREEYEKYFPESVEPYAPRSLKHLSRCQVRECMGGAGSLPFGIKMLNIPKLLKKYLELEDLENDELTALIDGLDKNAKF